MKGRWRCSVALTMKKPSGENDKHQPRHADLGAKRGCKSVQQNKRAIKPSKYIPGLADGGAVLYETSSRVPTAAFRLAARSCDCTCLLPPSSAMATVGNTKSRRRNYMIRPLEPVLGQLVSCNLHGDRPENDCAAIWHNLNSSASGPVRARKGGSLQDSLLASGHKAFMAEKSLSCPT